MITFSHSLTYTHTLTHTHSHILFLFIVHSCLLSDTDAFILELVIFSHTVPGLSLCLSLSLSHSPLFFSLSFSHIHTLMNAHAVQITLTHTHCPSTHTHTLLKHNPTLTQAHTCSSSSRFFRSRLSQTDLFSEACILTFIEWRRMSETRSAKKQHILDKTNDFKRVATKRTGITLLSFLLSTRSVSSSFTFRSILSKKSRGQLFLENSPRRQKKIASNRSLVSIEGKKYRHEESGGSEPASAVQWVPDQILFLRGERKKGLVVKRKKIWSLKPWKIAACKVWLKNFGGRQWPHAGLEGRGGLEGRPADEQVTNSCQVKFLSNKFARMLHNSLHYVWFDYNSNRVTFD